MVGSFYSTSIFDAIHGACSARHHSSSRAECPTTAGSVPSTTDSTLPHPRMPVVWQEQELRDLLEAAVDQSTSSSSSMPEDADIDMPDSPVSSGSPQLATANAADTLTAADKGQHSGDTLTTDPAGGGGGSGGVGGAAAGSYSHPVVELYRSIGQPLDQASFEELKRRVKSTMGKVGGEGLACIAVGE